MTLANMGMREDATLFLPFFTFASFQVLAGRYAVNLAFFVRLFQKTALICSPRVSALECVIFLSERADNFKSIYSIVPLLTYTVYVDNTNEVFLRGYMNRLSYHDRCYLCINIIVANMPSTR